jgi:hypothetical protein
MRFHFGFVVLSYTVFILGEFWLFYYNQISIFHLFL